MTDPGPNQTQLERELQASVVEVQQRKAGGIVRSEPTALAHSQEHALSVDALVSRVEKVKEVHKRLMAKDTHYGIIPGVKKDCLYKPGAELLGMAFQLGPKFTTEERRDGEHLECVVTCTLFQQSTGAEMGSGLGSCSTREKKYAWRGGGRKCPGCDSTTALTKSKDKAEWFCWRKKDGCGATFPEKDPRITSQTPGRTPNPDLADEYNTVRKMACKRAHVAAILFVTCASEIFTQDVEDMDRVDGGQQQGRGDGPPTVSQYTYADEDPHAGPVQSAEYDSIMKVFNETDLAIGKANPVTWELLCSWREAVGRRGDRAGLRSRAAAVWDTVSPDQRQALNKVTQRVERALQKWEKTVQAPGPADSFRDEDPI